MLIGKQLHCLLESLCLVSYCFSQEFISRDESKILVTDIFMKSIFCIFLFGFMMSTFHQIFINVASLFIKIFNIVPTIVSAKPLFIRCKTIVSVRTIVLHQHFQS